MSLFGQLTFVLGVSLILATLDLDSLLVTFGVAAIYMSLVAGHSPVSTLKLWEQYREIVKLRRELEIRVEDDVARLKKELEC